MQTAFGKLVAEQQGMVIARGARQSAEKHSLAHGHPFKVNGVIRLDDGIDPMNVIQAKTGIIVGRLTEVHYRSGEHAPGKATAGSCQQEHLAEITTPPGKLLDSARSQRHPRKQTQ